MYDNDLKIWLILIVFQLPWILKTMKRLCPASYMLSMNYEFITFPKRFSSRSSSHSASLSELEILIFWLAASLISICFWNYNIGKTAQCIFWFLEREFEGCIALFKIADCYQKSLLICFLAGISKMLKFITWWLRNLITEYIGKGNGRCAGDTGPEKCQWGCEVEYV